MSDPRDDKLVFALMPTTDGGSPLLSIGVPRAAWERLKDGIGDTIDLSPLGFPVRIMVFGTESHAEGVKLLMEGAKRAGVAVLDERRRDFSIKTKEEPENG